MPLFLNDAYAAKAAFFDSQVDADWAVRPYGPEEQQKLRQMFAVTGPLGGLQVMEPGCGTGRLTEVLARLAGPEGHVVAMDISPRMVAEARRRLSWFDNVDILHGAVEEKIGYTGHFDLVICHQVFPHFADPANALDVLAGMLKPGGRLVVSHFISSAEINDVHQKAGSAVAQDTMATPKQMECWCGLSSLVIETWRDDKDGYLLCARLI